MAEFSKEDFISMQEQTKRMMQGQGRRAAAPQARTPPAREPPPPPMPPAPPKKPGFAKLFEMINFKNMEMDSDRMVIVALALILASGEADELLILALIYIML